MKVEYFWTILKDSDKPPIMRFAANAETHKKIFMVFKSQCPENAPLFREIVDFRHEATRLMGFPNHAAFKAQYKSVKPVNMVNNFL